MSLTFPSPIFGPVHSRRLGISLGINLLPGDGKLCSFDCIYCECGLNFDHHPHSKIPTREAVAQALELQLQKMQQEQTAPDVLTFAGNGEPTLHPQFAEIIDDTIRLRNRYFPQAKISVLTNATQIHRPAVFDALRRVDNNICKLDTVNSTYINNVDRPQGDYDLERIIGHLTAFGTDCIIQTMFLQGTFEGTDISNVTDQYVLPWLQTIERIHPREVMIYTLDRDTPVKGLLKATPAQLDSIRDRVRDLGIPCSAAY